MVKQGGPCSLRRLQFRKPLNAISSDFKLRLTFFLKQQSIISCQNSQLVAWFADTHSHQRDVQITRNIKVHIYF